MNHEATRNNTKQAAQKSSRLFRVVSCDFVVTSSRALLLFRFNLLLVLFTFTLLPTVALADKLHLTDGTTIEADEAWDDAQGVWYRRGGVTYSVERARVSKIEHEQHTPVNDAPKHTQTSRVLDASAVVGQTTQAPQPGARATDIAAVRSTDAPHQPVYGTMPSTNGTSSTLSWAIGPWPK